MPDLLYRYGQPIRYSYVDRAWPLSYYQTVFATVPGSAEMPSAARPFTDRIVTRLVSAGVLLVPILLHTGVASLDFYIQQWRIAILIICVISMVLTPADPVSMLLMAVPLCLLYLLGIAMRKYMPSGKSQFAEAYEP